MLGRLIDMDPKFYGEGWPHFHEILPGKNSFHYFTENFSHKTCLPIALTSPNNFNASDTVEVFSCGKKIKLKNIGYKRWQYLPLESGSVEIKSTSNIIVGKPIPLTQQKRHNIKKVIYLFIDGLASEAFNYHDIKDLMPNTYNFFVQGKIFKRCHANAEWSLPSIPTFFTGKYCSKNLFRHPNKKYVLGDNEKILSEYFQEAGYLTFQLCNVRRKTPTYGYCKGFDRTVFQHSMKSNDVIFEAIDQLTAFPDRDQFGWLSFFDLHHHIGGIPDISVQTQVSLKAHDYYRKGTTIIPVSYDHAQIERYLAEIKKLDQKLKTLYDYILSSCNNNEFLVILCSDHGRPFLSHDTHLLSQCKIRVPFMIRGENISPGIHSDLIENVDIFPTILNLCKIQHKMPIDGNIPTTLGGKKRREFVFSESIYPESTYKVALYDEDHVFYFETKNIFSQDFEIDFNPYTIKLFKNDTLEEIKSDLFFAKIKYYTNYVLDRIMRL